MIKYIFPIVFLRTTPDGVVLKCNAFSANFKYLVWHLEGDDTEKYTKKLDTDEVEVIDFPDGPGNYEFYLQKGESDTRTKGITFYVNPYENAEEVFRKIYSYITYPEDNEYMTNRLLLMRSAYAGYTRTVVKAYRSENNKQPYEYKSFYQFLNMMERYENLLALNCNKNAVRGVKISYGPCYTIIPNNVITSIDVYKSESQEEFIESYEINSEEPIKILFGPDTIYILKLMVFGEQVAELIHYQFDEKGSAYFWNNEYERNNLSDENIANDLLIAHTGVEISAEDKIRLLEEYNKRNLNAFIPKISVTSALLNNYDLTVNVQKFDILQAIGKKFYITVAEKDEFVEDYSRQRFLITDYTNKINAAKSYLDDEVIFSVEDENHKIVSDFVRYDINGDMSEYEHVKNAVENNNFITKICEAIMSIYGSGKIYDTVSDLAYQKSQDSEITVEELYHELIIGIINDTRLNDVKNELIYLLLSAWMTVANYDAGFFGTQYPLFYRSRDRFSYPVMDSDYILIDEYYDLGSDKWGYQVQASSNQSTDYKIHDHSVHVIYAIDCKTYMRSGFVLISHLNGDKFYTNNIKIEVITDA